MSASDYFVDVDEMDENFLGMEMKVKVGEGKNEKELEGGEIFDLVEDFEELIEDRTQKSVSFPKMKRKKSEKAKINK